ncbi:response regulator transcription factor [Candidatus Uhrbacteria bacterium]|nr:response regulator transcription factor [Candidatus Uhrbacteria bacterium]
MDLARFIQSHQEQLGPLHKVATDIAALIEHPRLLQQQDEGERQRRAQARLELFEAICALAVQNGVPLPPLDPDLVADARPSRRIEDESQQQADAIIRHVREQLSGDAGQLSVLCLVETLSMMPQILRGFVSLRDAFMANLNHALLQAELLPFRRDHTAMKILHAAHENGPTSASRVLIVDDSSEEIVRTWRAMCGWPNLILDTLFVEDDTQDTRRSSSIASAVLKLEPALVLMDQGLPNTAKGSDVIREIRLLHPETSIVFVANTGGEPDELNDVGAIGNACKGRHLESIRRGIRMLG